jgi:type I restriction enzyme S subunit
LALPSISEQRRIADILDAADDAIRHTEALIAKLRHAKVGLLRDLLTRGLDEQGRLRDSVAHPEQFRDSPLGRIPREWEVKFLAEVAEVGSGVTLGRDLQGPSTIELPYLRVANVQDGYLDMREVKLVRVLRSDVPKYLLAAGDVLMTEGGDFDKLGRGTVWRGQIAPCLHQNHIFRVHANTDRLLPDFLAAVTASHLGRAYFLRSSKQTTNLASINSTQLKAFPVPCPRLDEQEEIVMASQSLDRRLEAEEACCDKLKLQKQGLMHDLLTGRVRV